jgi:hypothetical protein
VSFTLIVFITIAVAFLAMADIVTWLGVGIGISIPTAVAIGLSGLGIIIEMRKQSNKYGETKQELAKLQKFMETTSLSQIHEKIAMLNNYLSEIPWASKEIANHKSKKIVSDIVLMAGSKARSKRVNLLCISLKTASGASNL